MKFKDNTWVSPETLQKVNEETSWGTWCLPSGGYSMVWNRSECPKHGLLLNDVVEEDLKYDYLKSSVVCFCVCPNHAHQKFNTHHRDPKDRSLSDFGYCPNLHKKQLRQRKLVRNNHVPNSV